MAHQVELTAINAPDDQRVPALRGLLVRAHRRDLGPRQPLGRRAHAGRRRRGDAHRGARRLGRRQPACWCSRRCWRRCTTALERRTPVPPLTEGNGYAPGAGELLPASLRESINALEQGTLLRGALGDAFVAQLPRPPAARGAGPSRARSPSGRRTATSRWRDGRLLGGRPGRRDRQGRVAAGREDPRLPALRPGRRAHRASRSRPPTPWARASTSWCSWPAARRRARPPHAGHADRRGHRRDPRLADRSTARPRTARPERRRTAMARASTGTTASTRSAWWRRGASSPRSRPPTRW